MGNAVDVSVSTARRIRTGMAFAGKKDKQMERKILEKRSGSFYRGLYGAWHNCNLRTQQLV